MMRPLCSTTASQIEKECRGALGKPLELGRRRFKIGVPTALELRLACYKIREGNDTSLMGLMLL